MTLLLTTDEELISDLGGFAYDPLGFVLWAFPWGEPGTELANETGPDEWQRWLLEQVGAGLITLERAIQIAVASGHGIGKSAVVAWLVWWAYSTFPGTRGVVTANTENQLKTKTWVEIAKWHRLFIAKHLFKCTATAIFSVDEEQAREWRIDIVPWSERNTEAFAGLHNAGKRIIVIFDEGSAIPDVIWETTEGALTDIDTEILWLVFGNPTRTTGRFRECFEGGRFAHRWITRRVDSRTVRRTNKTQLDAWVRDWGLESDFVRVRILGEFPNMDSLSFISRDLAQAAVGRVVEAEGPVVIGVDVARFGTDFSVIWPRQGRDASSRTPIMLQGVSTDMLAHRVIRAYNEWNASLVFIDGTGVGGGVVDTLRASGIRVYEVTFGASPDGFSTTKYFNKRAEIWGGMKDWLAHGSIPGTVAGMNVVEQLIGPSYGVTEKDAIKLESKDLMRRRGVDSPDLADALACTFAYPTAEAHIFTPVKFKTDYDHLAEELP